jgi:tryptophan synthase alpha chain
VSHTRLGTLFAAGRDTQSADTRKKLVTFITAGDPGIEATVPAMHALVAGGADIIELGIPFSDPEADGPVIQAASERALAAGTRFSDVLAAVTEFRQTDSVTPVVLMGYLNTITAQKDFAARAEQAEVDGLIMVNLPPEEAEDFRRRHAGRKIDLIFLVAPTTANERIKSIARAASGFLYYVSFKGITGADRLEVDEVAKKVATIKASTSLPVCVGFGIKDGETAARVAAIADGVVVGTALVRIIAETAGGPEAIAAALKDKVAEFRMALDR